MGRALAGLSDLLPSAGTLRYSEQIEEKGTAFYESVARMGLEGVIAKQADAPYRAGRSKSWLKIKADPTDDFVVIGWTAPGGSRTGFGALLLAQFHWILYVFGAMLVFTGVRMMFKQDEEFDGENNRIVKIVRRRVPMTFAYHDSKFFVTENGTKLATPLFLVLILIEFTDLIFAVDSIPAIFGITRDPFIVFTSNIFAILGLRSMFFLLAAVVERFYLLKYGLSIILTFIGVKMLIEGVVHIPISWSLAVVLGTLFLSVIGSLIWPKPEQAPEPIRPEGTRTGSIFGAVFPRKPRPNSKAE